MGDQAYSRAGTAQLMGAGAGGVQIPDVCRWIAPQYLAETWLPNYFHPRYDSIESSVTESSQRWIRLGDLVEQFSPAPHPSGLRVGWSVEGTSTSLRILESEQPEVPAPGSLILPDRAIILHLAPKSPLAVEYWDSSVYQGGGSAGPDLLVVTASSSADPAWIAWELRTNEIVALQIDRARHGTIIPRVDRSLLFSLWLPLPRREQQIEYGNTVRGVIRENQSLARAQKLIKAARRNQRDFVVTGATLQDRLRQFENYLIEEKWFSAGSLFSVDTGDGNPKFNVRPIGRAPKLSGITPISPETAESDEWSEWCSTTERPWRLFNSLLHTEDLPHGILAQIVANTEFNTASFDLRLVALPVFNVWRQVYRAVWDLQGTLNPSDWSQLLEIWRPFFGGPPKSNSEKKAAYDDHSYFEKGDRPESSLIAAIRQISRPILALKAVYEGKVARVFLIVGQDQADDPLHAAALLEGYASILSESLNRATHFAVEAAQKESMRRLSWLRHHLNGPLGIASNALDDIKVFLNHNPEIAKQLVPNSDVANKMAARPGRSIGQYTLHARLSILEREITNLKGLSDRIKQLSEIDAIDLTAVVDVAALLRERAEERRELVAGLVVDNNACKSPVLVVGNPGYLGDAFNELLFNACREFREYASAEPAIAISAMAIGDNAIIIINDNALPAREHMPGNPFGEGVSKYRGAAGGTGLGLTIVREIAAIHGGRCLLEENRAPDLSRIPGVTFTMTLPLRKGVDPQ